MFDNHTSDLIQKGGTFVPLPRTINKTEVHSSIKRFERKCQWKAFWANEDQNNTYIPPLFPVLKDNLPSKPPPKPLADALAGIRSEILTSPLNHVRDNLSTSERVAMKNLIDLRSNGEIIIQPLDKTGGLAIFDREDYITGIGKILKETATTSTGIVSNNYKEVTNKDLKIGLTKVRAAVEAAENSGFLDKDEASAMIPSEAKPGRLYGLAKDHKEFVGIPPFRPIVSGSGCLTENISLFLDHHAKPLVSKLPSFIEDTPDFLRAIEELKEEDLPTEAIPVTIDVVGLYGNIPQNEAISTMSAMLDTRSPSLKKTVPTSFLVQLLTLVLTLNIFTFDGKLFQQLLGVAMGTRSAPSIANIFMGSIEKQILMQAPGVNFIFKKFWRRFIDDIFLIWTGSEEQLITFLDFINTLHPTIKFTSTYDFKSRTVPFLDTSITIEKGKITSDLYRKPTHSPQYLLPSSTHPPHCTKNIPYSLGYRLLRICSDPETLKMRIEELREMLIHRGYSKNIISGAFTKLSATSREVALKKVFVDRSSNDKVTFVIPFDPRLPKISEIANRHFNLLKSDKSCAKIFKAGVQVAYKRHPNIKEVLCRAIVPPLKKRVSTRDNVGWKTCQKLPCSTCTYSKSRTSFKVKATGKTKTINQKITCQDTNVIYCIECEKCGLQYVGKTKNSFKTRCNQHSYAVRHFDAKEKEKNNGPVAEHFNKPGHSSDNMHFFAFEKVISIDPFTLGTRERYHIDDMDVISKGLNRNRTS